MTTANPEQPSVGLARTTPYPSLTLPIVQSWTSFDGNSPGNDDVTPHWAINHSPSCPYHDSPSSFKLPTPVTRGPSTGSCTTLSSESDEEEISYRSLKGTLTGSPISTPSTVPSLHVYKLRTPSAIVVPNPTTSPLIHSPSPHPTALRVESIVFMAAYTSDTFLSLLGLDFILKMLAWSVGKALRSARDAVPPRARDSLMQCVWMLTCPVDFLRRAVLLVCICASEDRPSLHFGNVGVLCKSAALLSATAGADESSSSGMSNKDPKWARDVHELRRQYAVRMRAIEQDLNVAYTCRD